MDLKYDHHTVRSKIMQVTKGAVIKTKEYNQSRVFWKLCFVTDIHHGRDRIVRTYALRLATGSFIRRAVQHLYPLKLHNFRNE